MPPLINVSKNQGSRTLGQKKPLGQNPPAGPNPRMTVKARTAAYVNSMKSKYNARRLINNHPENGEGYDNWAYFKTQRPSFNQLNPMIYKLNTGRPSYPIHSGGKTRKNRKNRK